MKNLILHGQKAWNHRVVRFILSGGTATLVDLCTYFFVLHFLFKGNYCQLGNYTISAPVASLIISYSAGLVTNFLISKYFVFKESEVKTGKQMGRYLLVAFSVFLMNYGFMKFLIGYLNIYPTIARAFSAGVIAVVSFQLHNIYSFATKKVKAHS